MEICLGIYLKILLECRMSRKLTQRVFVGQIMKLFDDSFPDDDSVVSNIVLGRKNIPEYTKEKICEGNISIDLIYEKFNTVVTSNIDYKKYNLIIKSISFLIKENSNISPDSIVEYCSNRKKKELDGTATDITAFLLGIFLYLVDKKDNVIYKNIEIQKYVREIFCKAEKYNFDDSIVKEKNSEKKDFIDLKCFNGENFSSIGAAIIISNWDDSNSKDNELYELLTGTKYSNCIEEVIKAGLCTCKSNNIEINNKMVLRDELINILDGNHFKLLLDSFKIMLLNSSTYSQLSREALDSISDFLAYFSNNLGKCNRIKKSELRNLFCSFVKEYFVKADFNQLEILIGKMDILIEADMDTFLYVIEDQLDDEKSIMYKMLNSYKKKDISYNLAYSLSKSANGEKYFSRVLRIMFKLVRYHSIFVDHIVNLLGIVYKQIEVDIVVELGVLKRFLLDEKSITWNIIYQVVNNSITRKGMDIEFVYMPFFKQLTVEKEIIITRIEFIKLLCLKSDCSDEDIMKLIKLLPVISDEEVCVISDFICSIDVYKEINVDIYKSVKKYINNKKNRSDIYVKKLKNILDYYSASKDIYEKIELFQFSRHINQNIKDDEEAIKCINDIYEKEGTLGIVSFSEKIEDIYDYAKVVVYILSEDVVFSILDETLKYENKGLLNCIIKNIDEKGIFKYIDDAQSLDRLEILYRYKVSDDVLKYVNKKTKDIQKIYWENVKSVGSNDLSKHYFIDFIDKLVEYKNYKTAIDSLAISVDYGGENIDLMYKVLELYIVPDDIMKIKNDDSLEASIHIVIDYLQKNVGDDWERICRIEEKYILILREWDIVNVKYIYYKMANNPEYVKELCLKRRENINNLLYNELLYNFKNVPGTQLDGCINIKILEDWYEFVQKELDLRIKDDMDIIFAKGLSNFDEDKDVAKFIDENYKDSYVTYLKMELMKKYYNSNIEELRHIIDMFEEKAKKSEKDSLINLACVYRDVETMYENIIESK